MGVEVVVGGASAAELAAVARVFHAWELVFSRFRPESELSRLNRSSAGAMFVSPFFARVLGTALEASAATGGLVDPTLGNAIEAVGYDRDFTDVGDDSRPVGTTAPGRWRDVRLAGRLLTRPVGTAIDLNGVVKAMAVDEAVGLLAGDGFVAAGGDLAARGETTVALPEGGAVRLLAGGLATSGTTRRRWVRSGVPQHHLLDPRTGRPSRSCWTQVTVGAATCLAADVAAKAAFLLGGDGPRWLDARGLPGRFLAGSVVVSNQTWRERMADARQAAA
jgi:thiamine biosynthesis lipoprotein